MSQSLKYKVKEDNNSSVDKKPLLGMLTYGMISNNVCFRKFQLREDSYRYILYKIIRLFKKIHTIQAILGFLVAKAFDAL